MATYRGIQVLSVQLTFLTKDLVLLQHLDFKCSESLAESFFCYPLALKLKVNTPAKFHFNNKKRNYFMPNLYIFAIGGTGSRVIKALTMLMASGVEMKGVDNIVPIIVDPHRSNKDLVRTEDLLKNYQRIRNELKDPTGGTFFSPKISTLKTLAGDAAEIADTYVFELQGVDNAKFKDYISYNTLDRSNKALASLLFSEKNLETNMDIGFVGNPNIGSVVLNQFKDSKVFQTFASNFKQNDRIFIISSIFGGTGAAGFPIILKNIRGANPALANSAFLQNAKIGAATVLPYFGVEPDATKAIDGSTFVSKTKSALHYYLSGVNGSVDRLYYVGDEVNKNYINDPGRNGQQNDAHFVELATALSIVDFTKTPDALFDGNGTVFSEFAIQNDYTAFDLQGLTIETRQILAKPLTQMALFCRYMDSRMNNSFDSANWSRTSPKIDDTFLQGAFVGTFLKEFRNRFVEWLREMEGNQRSFAPFLMSKDVKLADTIRGLKPLESFSKGKLDFKMFDLFLSTVDSKKGSFVSKEDKLLSVFSQATEKLLNERYESTFKNL
jgi:hypothetical protein